MKRQPPACELCKEFWNDHLAPCWCPECRRWICRQCFPLHACKGELLAPSPHRPLPVHPVRPPVFSKHSTIPDPLPAALRRISDAVAAEISRLRQVFGPPAELKYRVRDGGVEFVAGYRSEFGFHLRGRGKTPAAAVDQAEHSRLSDDPCPQTMAGKI